MATAAPAISYQSSQQETPIRETDPHDTIRQNRDPEKIAKLAYSYWEASGRRDGSAEEDWARAEQALYGAASTTAA